MSVNKDKKSGKWYYSGKYKDIKGNYHDYKKRGFRLEREAKAAEEKFLSKINGPLVRVTMDSLVEMYAEEYEAFNVKESTLIGDECYYNNHIKEIFGSKFVDEIEPSDIEQFKVHMVRKPRLDKEGNIKGVYAERTINHALSVLSKYLSYAVKKGRIKHNPGHTVTKYKNSETVIKKSAKKENFWEEKEYDKFLSSVDDPYWHDVFEFMFGTGVREGELFGLTWDSIDLDDSKIYIEQNITSKTRAKGVKITTTKNANSNRAIDMQQYLHKLLSDRLNGAKKLDGFSGEYFVFGDIRPMARSTLAKRLDDYITKAGVKRITPHGFRHSHATMLILAKVDDTLIAERLGHTVAELRKTYAHIYEKQRANLKNVLDDIHNKRSNNKANQKSKKLK